MKRRPLIALTAGDPAGIGPEIVASALRDPALAHVRVLAIGPAPVRPDDVPSVADGSFDAVAATARVAAILTAEGCAGRAHCSAGEALTSLAAPAASSAFTL